MSAATPRSGRCATARPSSARRRDIVEMIRAYNDKVGGIDSVSLHFTPGNMPVESAERSLRLFAREVMPKVARL